MTTYTITDKQAQRLYDLFSTFRGGPRSNPRSKATPFDANRIREEFAAMHPQRQDEFARAVGAWIFYNDSDCEVYTCNGWKCVLHPKFTGWSFDVYIDGTEMDPDGPINWSNHPYNTKQDALDDFLFNAQYPPDLPDDEYFDFVPSAKAMVLVKRKYTRKPYQQRGSLHRSWAKLVKHKSGNQCEKCGSSEYLEAHHIEPYKDNESLRYSVDNGVALCKRCHVKHHKIHGK